MIRDRIIELMSAKLGLCTSEVTQMVYKNVKYDAKDKYGTICKILKCIEENTIKSPHMTRKQAYRCLQILKNISPKEM